MICDQISARLSVTMLCCCIDREVDPRRAIADIGCPGPESKLLGQNCAFNRRYPPRYPKVAFDSGTRIHTARFRIFFGAIGVTVFAVAHSVSGRSNLFPEVHAQTVLIGFGR